VGSDSNGGTGWGDAFATIQKGIDVASDGDTVLVADGVYVDEGNRDLVFRGKIITLQSENGPAYSIIDCQGAGRALSAQYNTSAKDVIVRGFTIKNGVSNSGGGIYWGYTSANLTVEDCIFHNNSNAAIRTYHLKIDSFVTIRNCDFIGNEGAVYPMNGGNVVITGCVFDGNTATFRAGVIRATGGTKTDIKNCIFTGNISNHDAGAISFEMGIHRLTNCIFAGNRAGERGGAIYTSHLLDDKGSLTIINCTFSNNEAHTGGAIWLSSDSFPIITNSILWENTPNEIYGGGGVPTVTYSDIQGDFIGEGNIDSDPLFVGGGDYHLKSGSPCIDAGNNLVTDIATQDMDAKPRFIDGDEDMTATVDMGAYEYGDICECDTLMDLDIDGLDLADYMSDPGSNEVSILAEDFGRIDCPNYQYTP
jgi:predicted outer membrane repeat protein